MNNYELYHYGILGMKWGVRRYQNEDGSLTELGKSHYGYSSDKATAKAQKQYEKAVKKDYATVYNKAAERLNSETKEFNEFYDKKRWL